MWVRSVVETGGRKRSIQLLTLNDSTLKSQETQYSPIPALESLLTSTLTGGTSVSDRESVQAPQTSGHRRETRDAGDRRDKSHGTQVGLKPRKVPRSDRKMKVRRRGVSETCCGLEWCIVCGVECYGVEWCGVEWSVMVWCGAVWCIVVSLCVMVCRGEV